MHQNTAVLTSGKPLAQAEGAVILIHGRGASAESILALANEFQQDTLAYLAPQARGNSWYPNSFMAPIPSNEPGISSGIQRITTLVQEVEAGGIPAEQIMIGGFSQGACLGLEFTARNARRYGGVFALSGGLIGPQGTPRDYEGSLQGTPIFIGCSDVDPHIPLERVHESTTVLQELGAEVDERIYPNMGHTVNRDELTAIREMLAHLGGT